MPVDADPVDDGNVLLDEEDGQLVATVVSPAGQIPLDGSPAGQIPLDGSPLHTSHFATCPNADQHRRPR